MGPIQTINQNRFNAEVNNPFNYSADDLYLISDRSVLPILYTEKRPFKPLSGCCVRVLKGEGEYYFNLVRYSMRPGDILFIPENSVFEIAHVSDDLSLHLFSYYRLQSAFVGDSHYCHVGDGTVLSRLTAYFDLMLQIAQEGKRSGISQLQLAFIDEVAPYEDRQNVFVADSSARSRELFSRFLVLVNANVVRERSVKFYADALAITPNWLSHVVKSHSGKTVLQWISHAVIQQARIQLAYFEKPINHISDQLNFTSPVDFSRFFRRETGETPSQFRARLRTG